MRAGSTALSVLSVPLNVHILTALEEEECGLGDLGKAVGLPPASTMRAHLQTLSKLGALERRQEVGFPGAVNYGITSSGEKLLKVAQALQYWLQLAPDGPIGLGSPAAKSATKALVDGWSTTIVRAVAARPVSLTELDRLIPQLSYPSLERRLTAMRRVGLLERQRTGSGRGTPYKASAWLREAVTPLTAGIGWERRCLPDLSGAIRKIDVEAAFLLAVPLLDLPPHVSGSCRLALEMRNGPDLGYAGVTVGVEEGRTVSCVARLEGQAGAWVAGTPLDWFGWVNGYDAGELEFGGDNALALALADGLRQALVPVDRV